MPEGAAQINRGHDSRARQHRRVNHGKGRPGLTCLTLCTERIDRIDLAGRQTEPRGSSACTGNFAIGMESNLPNIDLRKVVA